MKFRIISPDAANTIDHVLRNQMLRFMEESTQGVPFVPISYFPNYRFNPELLKVRSGYVLCDMTEYGWDWDQKTENVLGRGVTRQYTHIASDEWAKLDDYVRDNPPLLQFKRELKAADRSLRLLPMEHLCYIDPIPIQSKAEFDARPIEVNHTWGWSHPRRAILHADIFRAMTTHSIGVISELNHVDGYFKNPDKRTWATIYKPWYARSPVYDIMALNVKSKLSVSMPGAGNKCFRSCGESPVGSIMAHPEDLLAWTFPWDHGVNCIRLREGFDFADLITALDRNDLYEIYVNCQNTVDRYRSRRYVNEYVIPSIEALL